MDHTFDDNNNEDIDQSNDNLVIVNSLIIPNEQITAHVLKRLHQLQQVQFFLVFSNFLSWEGSFRKL